MRGRRTTKWLQRWLNKFQSTPPHEGATSRRMFLASSFANFNPRPLMRGRLELPPLPEVLPSFQSTPPHEGATWPSCGFSEFLSRFQSTPPHEGATSSPISVTRESIDFNPRPLMRGRPLSAANSLALALFQSTPPHEGATTPP